MTRRPIKAILTDALDLINTGKCSITIADLLEEIQAAIDKPSWRPIEEAPCAKDSLIIAHDGSGRAPLVMLYFISGYQPAHRMLRPIYDPIEFILCPPVRNLLRPEDEPQGAFVRTAADAAKSAAIDAKVNN